MHSVYYRVGVNYHEFSDFEKLIHYGSIHIPNLMLYDLFYILVNSKGEILQNKLKFWPKKPYFKQAWASI